MTKRVSYDSFCDKLEIYIINEFKGGENVVEIARNPLVDIVSKFEMNNKSVKLTDDEKQSDIDVEIKKRRLRSTSKI